MNKKVLLGLPYSPNSEFKSINRILNSNYGQVKILNYDDLRTGIDVLVIPHKIGISPNANGFIRGNHMRPVPDEPMCNYAARFMQNIFPRYAEARYPIVGIGDGAVNIWDSFNQKIDYVQDRLVCVPPDNDKYSNFEFDLTEMGWVNRFKIGSIYGFTNPHDPNFFKTIRLLIELSQRGELDSPDEIEEFGI